MDRSLPGSSVHGILQARIREWAAISFSRASSQPRNRTWVSRITGTFFTNWATRAARGVLELDYIRVVLLLSPVLLFVTPWTVACQASLSLEFPRQEYRSRLPFPTPGDLPNPGMEPAPCIAGGFFTTVPPRNPKWLHSLLYINLKEEHATFAILTE